MKKSKNYLLITMFLLLPLKAISAEPSYFIFSGPSSAVAGEDVSFTITPFDSEDQTINDYFGTVTLTASSGDGTISPSVTGNFSGSPTTWSGDVKLFAAGNITLTCTGPNQSTGTKEIEITPAAGIAHLMILPGQTHTPGVYPGYTPNEPNDVLQGNYYSLTVSVVDQYFNIVSATSDTITVQSYSSDYITLLPNASQLTTAGFAQYDFSYSIDGNQLSIYTLSAKGITNTASSMINVTAIDSGYLYFHTPDTIMAGVPFGLTMTVSVSDSDPFQLITTNSDTFKIKRFISGSSQAATGEWLPRENVTLSSGKQYYNDFTYDQAGEIFLNAEKIAGDGNVNIIVKDSSEISVAPNVPTSATILFSPGEIESKNRSTVTVTVFDEFNNPTISSLHNFYVEISKISNNGSFESDTITAQSQIALETNSSGQVIVSFVAGAINEEINIVASVKDQATHNEIVSTSNVIKVTAAPTKPGAIINYPNPFNPNKNATTSISYYLEEESDVELRIFDAFGRVVYSEGFNKNAGDPISVNATKRGGAEWKWDGKNAEGRVVANGIYFVRITARMPNKTQVYKRRVGVIK